MKPSEMSNEELAHWLIEYSTLAHNTDVPTMHEAATRLGNSIPKPVVEVRGHGWDFNGQPCLVVNINESEFFIKEHMLHKLRTALGLVGGE